MVRMLPMQNAVDTMVDGGAGLSGERRPKGVPGEGRGKRGVTVVLVEVVVGGVGGKSEGGERRGEIGYR